MKMYVIYVVANFSKENVSGEEYNGLGYVYAHQGVGGIAFMA